MAEALRRDLALLLKADERSSGERARAGALEIHFQEIHLASASGVVSGAEALVRWRHPDHGLLSPHVFIPIAEECGLISDVGLHVLTESCRIAASWPADRYVAVNVSPTQLLQPGFQTSVSEMLAKTGLPPSRLELELTETAVLHIDAAITSSLAALRATGVRIALDDFGCGLSSLGHLSDLEVDRLKIDRSFVALLGKGAKGAAIISAIVGLGKSLGIATTAEGIETEYQRDFLVALGCTELQGFYIAAPLPFLGIDTLAAGDDNRKGQIVKIAG